MLFSNKDFYLKFKNTKINKMKMNLIKNNMN